MSYFFFNDTATTEIYTLSLHDALPICHMLSPEQGGGQGPERQRGRAVPPQPPEPHPKPEEWYRAARYDTEPAAGQRSEEHTSELQSRQYLVCRLLLEKKKYNQLAIHGL